MTERDVNKSAQPLVSQADIRIISGLSALALLVPYLYVVSQLYLVPYIGLLLLDAERVSYMIMPLIQGVAVATWAWGGGAKAGKLKKSLWRCGAVFLAMAPAALLFRSAGMGISALARTGFTLLPLAALLTAYLAFLGKKAANLLLAMGYTALICVLLIWGVRQAMMGNVLKTSIIMIGFLASVACLIVNCKMLFSKQLK